MNRGIALAVLLAACGSFQPKFNGPVVLDHTRLCGSLDVYLAADRRGFYVVELLEGTEAHALDAIEAMVPVDEARAIAEFQAKQGPR